MSDLSTSSITARELIKAQRQWIADICERLGLTPTQLARQAGLTATTLTRLMNDPDHPHALSATTINKIVTKFPVPAPRSSEFVAFRDAVALAVQALHGQGALQVAPSDAVAAAILDLADWVMKEGEGAADKVDLIASFEAERLRRQRST